MVIFSKDVYEFNEVENEVENEVNASAEVVDETQQALNLLPEYKETLVFIEDDILDTKDLAKPVELFDVASVDDLPTVGEVDTTIEDATLPTDELIDHVDPLLVMPIAMEYDVVDKDVLDDSFPDSVAPEFISDELKRDTLLDSTGLEEVNGVDDLIAIYDQEPVALADDFIDAPIETAILYNTLSHDFQSTEGNDSFDGGSEDDDINGDAGDDNLQGGLGNDNLYGGNGKDVLGGSEGNDYIDGGSEDDDINGDAGDDNLQGGLGKDLLKGGNDNDVINGDSGNDHLAGDRGDDKLFGGSGKDTLSGGVDNDILKAGDGNDKLIADAGKEVMTGGKGHDTFVFLNESMLNQSIRLQDVIKDFVTGTDVIDLSIIDANTNTTATNDSFTFINNQAFDSTDATGQLRYDASNHKLYASTDSDTHAEVVIQLNGVSSLNVSDFIL
jgi:Ca2+-binding RTX toxin-like protein